MRKRVVASAVCGVAVVALGVGASAVADAREGAFAMNPSAQSYGSQLDAPAGEEPDLVLVVATNGLEGYVDREALKAATDPEFASPTEALAWQESMAGKVERIPVVLSDGRTPVGEFEIAHPTKDQLQEAQGAAPSD